MLHCCPSHAFMYYSRFLPSCYCFARSRWQQAQSSPPFNEAACRSTFLRDGSHFCPLCHDICLRNLLGGVNQRFVFHPDGIQAHEAPGRGAQRGAAGLHGVPCPGLACLAFDAARHGAVLPLPLFAFSRLLPLLLSLLFCFASLFISAVVSLMGAISAQAATNS